MFWELFIKEVQKFHEATKKLGIKRDATVALVEEPGNYHSNFFK